MRKTRNQYLRHFIVSAVLLIATCAMSNSFAQTTLSPGDIAIVGYDFSYNTSGSFAPFGNDNFDIVVLKNLTAGTVIQFSSFGWMGTAFTTGGTIDGTFTWTVGTAIPAGSVFNFALSNSSLPATVTVSPSNGTISGITSTEFENATGYSPGNGNQIFIYQGTSASPTFIYGVNTNAAGINTSTGWVTGTVANSAAQTGLPSGLTNAYPFDGTVSAPTALPFSIETNRSNAVYTGPKVGLQATLLTDIGNFSNWTTTATATSTYDLSVGGTYFSGSNPVFNLSPPTTIGSLTNVSSANTNAATVQYTATFAASITGLTTSNFSLTTTGSVSGASISGISGSGTTYTITVNTGTGDGTIQLNLANATGISPGISTTLPYSGTTYIIDKTAPTIHIGSPSVSSITAGTGAVTYAVTYADANFNASSLTTGNITLNKTSTASGTLSLSGSGTSYTVTISSITGAGTLGISIAAGTASDNAGNLAPASGASTTFNVVNPVSPTTTVISSSNNPSFSASPGNSVTFTATVLSGGTVLNEGTVTFTSNGSTLVGGSSVPVSAGAAAVTASFSTPGPYTIQATFNGDANYSTSNNSLTQQVNLHPTTISSLTAVSGTTTNAATVQYTATFAASITGLSTSNFSLNTTGSVSGASVASVSGSGSTYTITVNTGAGDGTIQLNLANAAGLSPGVSTTLPFSGDTFTIDRTAPTVSISAPSVSYANSSANIQYTVTFTDANMNTGTLPNFAPLFVYLNSQVTGSATINALSVNPSYTHSGNNYSFQVTFEDITGDGTLSFSVPAGVVSDNAGNTSTASAAATSVIIDNTAPAVNIGAPSVSTTSTGPVTYDVTYADANFNASTLSLSDITLNTTGTATGTVSLSGSGTSYTVTISNTTGHGTLGITIGPNTASDIVGNQALASGASDTFDVTSNDALLSVFQISNGTLSTSFSPTTNTYSDNIANLTSGITLYMTTDNPNATITVNGNPVTSGVRTSTIPMSLGLNTLTIVVTAQDGVTTNTYTVAVTRQQSTNASFTSVVLSPSVTLIGTTGPASLNFKANVANSVSSIQVISTAADATATITVNGTPVSSGTASQSITLPVGQTVITTVITAQDGTTTKNAIITVTRAAAADASLASLTASSATLSPAFSPVSYTYSATVPYVTTSITLTPTTDDPTATVTVNGTPVTSGNASSAIPLNVGANIITTVVTAQNGAVTKTYTTTITRSVASTNAMLTSIFTTPTTTLIGATGPGYLNFTANVPYGITSIQVTPTATDPTATIAVNGIAVASGTLSQNVSLSVGANTITTVLTAQDGISTKTVIITVTRAESPDASLANLTASDITLSPAFAASTYHYAGSVPYTTSSITLTPTTDDPAAAVTVNGVAVTSGTASNSIALNVGANTITTVVTAPNGVNTQTYTAVITRLVPSTNALLASVSLTPTSSLVSTTGAGYLNYTTAVVFTETSVQVTPTAKDATATITVNGIAVPSGALSQVISLNVGANVIAVVITAQDGVTSKTVDITVNRTGAADATLANLTSGGTVLSPAFASTTLSYTGTVPYTTSSITLIPVTNDPNATVTVNGSPATSGLASTVNLSAGLNTIKTVVTAQNGTTTKTYTTNITRTAPSTNALLASVTATPTVSLLAASGPGYLNYTAAVPNSLASIQFTPTAKDATATITVNGTAVTSGSLSQAIPLSVGANAVTIVLTAQDGVTQKSVDITVTRVAPPSDFPIYSLNKPTESVNLNDDGIVVHSALSPNGDGMNDYLTIDNITSYPDNHLTIVDRNGNMVYEAKGYDNGSKIFDGHSNAGKMQQPGTYFYSLSYTVKGETHSKTGYIILKY